MVKNGTHLGFLCLALLCNTTFSRISLAPYRRKLPVQSACRYACGRRASWPLPRCLPRGPPPPHPQALAVAVKLPAASGAPFSHHRPPQTCLNFWRIASALEFLWRRGDPAHGLWRPARGGRNAQHRRPASQNQTHISGRGTSCPHQPFAQGTFRAGCVTVMDIRFVALMHMWQNGVARQRRP